MKFSARTKIFITLVFTVLPALCNAERNKESLERYELSELKFELLQNDFNGLQPIAYIKDPEGYFHLAIVGSYIGKHFGKVTRIVESEINILEVYPDGKGGWKEIPTKLPRS